MFPKLQEIIKVIKIPCAAKHLVLLSPCLTYNQQSSASGLCEKENEEVRRRK